MTLLLTVLTTVTTRAWNGSGTSSSPYQITSTSDLTQLTNDVYNGNTYSGKYFKLMNDLVFTTSTSNWYAIAPTFASIGTDTNPFEGTFDGDNHTLTGVYIRRALNNKGDLYQGLFGVIGSGGVVKNIILTDSKIAASNYSGAIAGENRGTITNCHVTSSVIVSPQRDYVTTLSWESCFVGGIAGNNASGATISKCSSSAKIWTHEITTSNSSGNVWTRSYGGIAGVNAGNLNNCFALGVNTGIVKSDYGAITGYSNGTLANNYYADCYIVGQSSNVGTTVSGGGQADITTNDGAVGVRLITLSNFTTTSSDKVFTIPAHKELSGNTVVSVAAVNYNLAKVGTTVTLGHTEHSTDSYFFTNYSVKDADNANVTVSGNTFTMPDKNVTATAVFTNYAWSGSGNSESDPYLITSPEQLILLARRVNNGTGPQSDGNKIYRNKFFKVTQGITFTASTTWDDASSTENNFTPIGGATTGTTMYSFAGTFDGGGKAIKGIRIYQPDKHYEGLFGSITSEAVVKNVSLDDARITGKGIVGGIVGSSSGTVINCAVGGNVGIVGKKYEDQYHGGVVGENTGTVEGCRSLAKLTYNGNTSIYWGGIAGSNSGTLKNNLVYNATVNCPQSGAIVGKNEGTLISNYYYSSTINGTSSASNVGVYDASTSTLSDIDGARYGVRIAASNNAITIEPTGEATTYDVSKITVYEGNNVLKFLTLFFSGATKTVNFGLSHSSATGNVVKYYDGNDNELTAGGDNTYTYTMTNQALTIKATLIPDWALKNSGDTEDDAYVINTANQLNLLSERVNADNTYEGKYFRLGNNITYDKTKENNFTPIGKYENNNNYTFKGNFDGQGHTISGVNVNTPDKSYVGIFGSSYGGYIKNLKVANSTFTGDFNVGAILGSGGDQIAINNCVVAANVTVSGQNLVGGIAGQRANVIGCTSAATVSGDQCVGGIIGYINSVQPNTQDCLYLGNSVTLTSTYTSVGAIIGANGGSNNVANNYYTADLDCGGVKGSDADGARKAVEITSTINGLAFQPTGTATTYDVSGISTYSGNTAIGHSNGNSTKYYAGATETVSLDITYTAPEGFSPTGFNDGNGNALTLVSGNTWTLVVPATTAYIAPTGQDLWGVALAGSDGSADHPYVITEPAGIDLLAQKVNGTDGYTANTFDGTYFELGNDITYDYASLGEDESNYTAIGTSSNPFGGHFDGKGHTISGIRINADTNYQGPFGYISAAEVKNLTIADTRIAIGGNNKYAAGIVGYNYNGSIIENCHTTSDVYVTAQTDGSYGEILGGIVGDNFGTRDNHSIVRGCTSAAHVSGNWFIGGIAGDRNDRSNIANCLVRDAVLSGKSNVGAIIGAGHDDGTLTNNRYTAGTSVRGATGGGHGTGNIGDIDGQASIAYSFPGNNPYILAALGTEGATYGTGDYQGITAYENGLAYGGHLYYPYFWTGSGIADDPYVIYDTTGLDKLASEVNGGNEYSDKYFALGDDIAYDGTENNYTPIGIATNNHRFAGTFDGRGYTVSGINVNLPDNDNIGIFGAGYGTVKNLKVANSTFTGHNDVGAIVGAGYSSKGDILIQNCVIANDVTVAGNQYVGGIAGYYGNVIGCTTAATVSGTQTVGGIIGYIYYDYTISHNLNLGPTVSCNSYVGAIIGFNQGSNTVINNYYTADGHGGIGQYNSAIGIDEEGARKAIAIGSAADVTIAPTGTETAYTLSGITAYDGNRGLIYSDGTTATFYAGKTETVSLHIAYTSGAGEIATYTDGHANRLAYVSGSTYDMTLLTDQAPVVTRYVFSDWAYGKDGSESQPYLISNTDQLDLLAQRVNAGESYSGKYFELTGDLDYSTVGLYLDGGSSNYTAIGDNDHRFGGHFDGKGHTISGIVIYKGGTESADKNQGLFGFIEGAEVKNLTLTSSTITAYDYTGGIVGHNNAGTIENCHVTSTVTIQSVVSKASIVGGIVGGCYIENSFYPAVRGCTSAATVRGNDAIGGIAGLLDGGTIENCLMLGAKVSATYDAGAIVGYNNDGTLTNNRYTAATKVNGATGAGHGIGTNGDIDGQATVAYRFPTDIDDLATVMGAQGSAYTSYEGRPAITAYENGLYYDGSLYYPAIWSGSGTSEADPYVIYTAEGLDHLAEMVNNGIDIDGYSGKYFALGHDIAYDKTALTLNLRFDGQAGNDSNFPGIGDYVSNNYNYFYGSFDGRGHTVSGIVIHRPNTDNVGFFANVYGKISNLTLGNSDITGKEYVGGICGYGNSGSNFENCHVLGDVTVSGTDGVGGIVGRINNCPVSGCTSAAAVSGTNEVGGIIGTMSSCTISDCLYLGTTVTGSSCVGAISGYQTNGDNFTRNYYTAYGLGGVGQYNSATGSDVDGAQFAYEFAAATGAMGAVVSTYAEGTDNQGITVYTDGLAYNGKYYCTIPWTGDGTAEHPFVISTTDGLDLLASKVNSDNDYLNTYFVLGDDIAYDKTKENNYTTIGDNQHPFSGTFDGQGHKVSGIRISDTNDVAGDYKAIFGMVDGTVKNLVVSDCSIEARQEIGGIVALLQFGTIENCHVGKDVILSGNAYVGGIAADISGGSIKGCTSAATITGTKDSGCNAEWLGGIVSYASEYGDDTPTLSDNLFTGTISGDLNDYIGAIVGWYNSDAATITNNFHTCSSMGGAGSEGSATGSDVDGAQFAVSSDTEPDEATIGTAGKPYAEGKTYQGITPYTHGLYYNNRYYWHGTVRPGDANGDGEVNISDAVAIVNYILGNPSAGFNEAAADVNGDGKITISDAVAVVNMLQNKTES